jgi:hypothetical protein
MEKINTGLKFILLLGTVLALLGFVEIQAYRTVDKDSVRRAMEGELALADEWVVKKTVVRTNYRLVLKL